MNGDEQEGYETRPRAFSASGLFAVCTALLSSWLVLAFALWLLGFLGGYHLVMALCLFVAFYACQWVL